MPLPSTLLKAHLYAHLDQQAAGLVQSDRISRMPGAVRLFHTEAAAVVFVSQASAVGSLQGGAHSPQGHLAAGLCVEA